MKVYIYNQYWWGGKHIHTIYYFVEECVLATLEANLKSF